MLPIHSLYRRSCNSVLKTFGFDVTATSHMTSNFNMADVNVYKLDSFMGSPTLKSNAGDQNVCKKKNLSWLFGADIKIRPLGSLFAITRQGLVTPNNDPRTDFAIYTSHRGKILLIFIWCFCCDSSILAFDLSIFLSLFDRLDKTKYSVFVSCV